MIDPIVGECERVIELGSKSFAAAARLLPKVQREDAVLLYSWCRHCDDVIDGQVLGHLQPMQEKSGHRQRIDELRRATERALHGDEPVAVPFEALRQVVRRHDIPLRHPMELLAGLSMDVEGRTYGTIEETLDYAYHVAGAVGVMMAITMGVRDQRVLDRASDLGIAFQLTNIARDVIDDLKVGRLYIPRDWMAAEGLADVDPSSAQDRARLHRCAQRLVAMAEPYYESALVGVAALPPRSAWAIAAARRIYRDIGFVVSHGGPDAWRTRPSVSAVRKSLHIAQALVDILRIKWAPTDDLQDRRALWTKL